MTGADLLLLATVFIVVNGIFVAAEFALIATPRAALEHRAGGGDRFARRILGILDSPVAQDRYFATSQLGITSASVGLGMFGEHALAEVFEPWLEGLPFAGEAALASALSLILLTLAHIVFGEMVPKGLALQRPRAVGRFTSGPMRVLLLALYPFVTLSSGITGVLLRLAGIHRQPNEHEHSYSPEELQLIVQESEQGGALRADSGRLLRELFEFGDLTARAVMVPRVRIVGIPAGASADEVRTVIATRRHTRYVVYDGDLDHIVGMVHMKDLLRPLLRNEPLAAGDARRLPVVPETAPLDDVLALMQRAGAHMALVIDEHGGTEGLVTLEDLFEEVVGEIDEGAPAAPPLTPQPDGSVLAAGTVRLDELGQHFDLDLRHAEVDSISGLVLASLDRPPVVGDVVEYGRVRLDVTATMGRGVREVRVRLLPVPGAE